VAADPALIGGRAVDRLNHNAKRRADNAQPLIPLRGNPRGGADISSSCHRTGQRLRSKRQSTRDAVVESAKAWTRS
jgi:hypothetical protein